MNTARQWLVGSLAGAAALALAASIALAAGSAAPTAQTNRAAAQADAARSLALVQLPPGAVPSAGEPAGDEGLLNAPPFPPLGLNGVDDHTWSTVSGSPSEVVAYVLAHLPPTATPDGTRSGDQPLLYAGESFTLAPVARTLTMRVVSVLAVQLTPSTTAVRADGAAVWFLPRPDWDRIPAGVRRAVFTAQGPTLRFGLGPRSAPRQVDGWRARRLAALINRLEPLQPFGVPPPCALLPPRLTELTFYGSSRAPLARAVEHETGCPGFVLLRVGDRTGPELTEPLGLTLELERLGAIPVCAAAQLRVSASLATTLPGLPGDVNIFFTNTSRGVCRLSGFPRISLLDRRGRQVPTKQTDVGARDVRNMGLKAALALDPGEQAPVGVSFSFCRAPKSGLRIVLPGERHPFAVRVGSSGRLFDACPNLSVTSL